MHYQEWGCARQKLDKTDTERCLGIDELGRFVWHCVANGGSRIEVDKEETRFAPISERKTHGCTQGVVLRSRAKDDKISTSNTTVDA